MCRSTLHTFVFRVVKAFLLNRSNLDESLVECWMERIEQVGQSLLQPMDAMTISPEGLTTTTNIMKERVERGEVCFVVNCTFSSSFPRARKLRQVRRSIGRRSKKELALRS
jgi:hypothetical protein